MIGTIGKERDCIFLRFSPRYLGHEEYLSETFQLHGVSDISLVTGFKKTLRTVWGWLRGNFRTAPGRGS